MCVSIRLIFLKFGLTSSNSLFSFCVNIRFLPMKLDIPLASPTTRTTQITMGKHFLARDVPESWTKQSQASEAILPKGGEHHGVAAQQIAWKHLQKHLKHKLFVCDDFVPIPARRIYHNDNKFCSRLVKDSAEVNVWKYPEFAHLSVMPFYYIYFCW